MERVLLGFGIGFAVGIIFIGTAWKINAIEYSNLSRCVEYRQWCQIEEPKAAKLIYRDDEANPQ